MPHRNAPLTELGRLRLARCVVDDGWPLRRAAERHQVSVTTAARWAARYRAEGAAGMVDRSSRPHRCPSQTRPRLVKKVVHLRTSRGWGPARIGPKLGMAVSTVHKILLREGLPRLDEVDLATRRQLRRAVRRYEHPAPGDLVHVDIKKLGRIPDGGGWRSHGRTIGSQHSSAHRDPTRPRKVHGRPNLGYGYIHTALDDHSRLAYTEILSDETGPTAAAFWIRAHAWFTAAGITVHAVLTDNGAATDPAPSPPPWPQTPSPTAGPAPTGRRPTARSNASTAPCSSSGPTPAPTNQRPNGEQPCPPGCTSTTITATTPHSVATHPPAASLTSVDRTASRPGRRGLSPACAATPPCTRQDGTRALR